MWLLLALERAKPFYNETLPADIDRQVEFCTMCGPKYCLMKT